MQLTPAEAAIVLQSLNARKRDIQDYLAIKPLTRAKGMLETDLQLIRKLYQKVIDAQVYEKAETQTRRKEPVPNAPPKRT